MGQHGSQWYFVGNYLYSGVEPWKNAARERNCLNPEGQFRVVYKSVVNSRKQPRPAVDKMSSESIGIIVIKLPCYPEGWIKAAGVNRVLDAKPGSPLPPARLPVLPNHGWR
jgi:hypothetical protein